jgi:hypothetical protein
MEIVKLLCSVTQLKFSSDLQVLFKAKFVQVVLVQYSNHYF